MMQKTKIKNANYEVKNYYETLNINFTATQEEIKKAFRINAIKYHPDKNSGDPIFTKKFIDVKEAYDILSNFNTRKEYDSQYQNLFGGQDTDAIKENQQKQRQERTKQRQQEENQYRYDPYKSFYSIYDREQQETAQFPPQQTPWGEKIGEEIDFFVLPKKIGKIIGGFSTLFKGVKAISPLQLFLKVVKSTAVGISITAGIAFLLYCHWTFNLHRDESLFNALIFFFVIIGIILGFKLFENSNETKFVHTCYFIGINGFAYYKCQGTKENIKEQEEINFHNVTDLISRFEIKNRNFQYVSTQYQFLWLNTKTGQIVSQRNGVYHDKDDNPNKNANPEYWLNKEAEKYWTVFLLDNMEKVLEEKGYLEFNIYSFEKNGFQPYIRVGIGYITFIKDKENFTYKFNEIKKLYTKGADLYIEHLNFEKKMYFFKSGNQDSIPLRMVCNSQFFFKALELLLGYKIG